MIDENSPTGQPSFAIYHRDTGNFVEALDYPGAEGEPYWIGNADDYQASASGYIGFLASLAAEQRAAARVMSVEQYNDLPAQNHTKGSVFKGTRIVLAFDPGFAVVSVSL